MNFKTLVLISVLSFNYSITNAQNFPFPQDTASWEYLSILWDSGSQSYPNSFTYHLYGDTIINDLQYSFITHYYRDCTNYLDLSYPHDFIRSENNRVYFLQKDSSSEHLLYDFNLEIGDYFPVNPFCGEHDTDSIRVEQIDSVLINGEYRKRWQLGESRNGLWVEGIGTLGGYGTMISPFYSDLILQ